MRALLLLALLIFTKIAESRIAHWWAILNVTVSDFRVKNDEQKICSCQSQSLKESGALELLNCIYDLQESCQISADISWSRNFTISKTSTNCGDWTYIGELEVPSEPDINDRGFSVSLPNHPNLPLGKSSSSSCEDIEPTSSTITIKEYNLWFNNSVIDFSEEEFITSIEASILINGTIKMPEKKDGDYHRFSYIPILFVWLLILLLIL